MWQQHSDVHSSPHFCAAVSRSASHLSSCAHLQVPACRRSAVVTGWRPGLLPWLQVTGTDWAPAMLSLSAEPAAHQGGTLAAGHSPQAEHPCGLSCVPLGHDSFPDAHSRQAALPGAKAPRRGGHGCAWRHRQHTGKQVCQPAVLLLAQSVLVGCRKACDVKAALCPH